MKNLTIPLFFLLLFFIGCKPEFIDVAIPRSIDCSLMGCGEHGTCNQETNVCECEEGYKGPFCIKTFKKKIEIGQDIIGGNIVQTQDGGFVCLASVDTMNNGLFNIYLIKTDSEGNTLWERTYGGPGEDYGTGLIETFDGRLAIVGRQNIDSSMVYLLITDKNGENPIERIFGGNIYSIGHDIIETSEGNFVLVGVQKIKKEGEGETEDHLYMVLTDENGENPKEVLMDDKSMGNSLIEVNEELVVIGALNKRIGFFKFSKQGEILLSKPLEFDAIGLGYIGEEIGVSILPTEDGGFIITGSYFFKVGRVILTKVTAASTLSWSKYYEGVPPQIASGISARETVDNGYLVLAGLREEESRLESCALMKMDSKGNLLWDKQYTGSRGQDLKETSDGGFVFLTKDCSQNPCQLILHKVHQLGGIYE